MEVLSSTAELHKEIKENSMLLVYISGGKCSVCTVIKGKAKIMISKYPKIKAVEIDGDKHPDIAAELSVFSLPGILIYAEGTEIMREARNISLEILDERICRIYNMLFSDNSKGSQY